MTFTEFKARVQRTKRLKIAVHCDGACFHVTKQEAIEGAQRWNSPQPMCVEFHGERLWINRYGGEPVTP